MQYAAQSFAAKSFLDSVDVLISVPGAMTFVQKMPRIPHAEVRVNPRTFLMTRICP